jgi:hypothetical protein
MTLHRRLRIVATAAVAAAVAVPVAAAARPGGTVQIGGELVAPAQLSSWQAHSERTYSPRLVQIGGALVSPENVSSWQARSERTYSPRLVQIGGALVSPEQVSSWQAHASQADALKASASDGSGFNWGAAGIGMFAALGVALFVGASAYIRRMRLTSA